MTNTALTLAEFFQDPKGPIGVIIGGMVVTLTLVAFLFPYYPLPEKVTKNTQRIKELERKQKAFDVRFNQIEGRLNEINDNQLLLVCNSPYVGDQYKQSRRCEKAYPSGNK